MTFLFQKRQNVTKLFVVLRVLEMFCRNDKSVPSIISQGFQWFRSIVAYFPLNEKFSIQHTMPEGKNFLPAFLLFKKGKKDALIVEREKRM